jgi:hypothetical protein
VPVIPGRSGRGASRVVAARPARASWPIRLKPMVSEEAGGYSRRYAPGRAVGGHSVEHSDVPSAADRFRTPVRCGTSDVASQRHGDRPGRSALGPVGEPCRRQVRPAPRDRPTLADFLGGPRRAIPRTVGKFMSTSASDGGHHSSGFTRAIPPNPKLGPPSPNWLTRLNSAPGRQAIR